MSKSIYDISGEIDEKFIDEAQDYSAKGFSKKRLFQYGSLCASFLIVVISAILIFPSVFAPQAEDSSKSIEYVEQGGGAKTPWKERPSYERFPRLTFNDISYSASSKTIEEERLGELLKEDVILGYDEANNKSYEEDIEIYSIQGIDSSKAVAVKIDSESEYYIYNTSGYIGGAIEIFDLDSIVPSAPEFEF